MSTTWPVPIEELDTRLFGDLKGVLLDLDEVIQVCLLLEQAWADPPQSYTLIDALSSAAVVRYARCFAKGFRHRLSDTSLESLSEDDREIHEYVLALRDKHVAHSVNPFESNVVVAVVTDDPVATSVQQIQVLQGRRSGLTFSAAQRLKSLAHNLTLELRPELEKECGRLLEQVNLIPFDELRKRPMPAPFLPRESDVGVRRGSKQSNLT